MRGGLTGHLSKRGHRSAHLTALQEYLISYHSSIILISVSLFRTLGGGEGAIGQLSAARDGAPGIRI
jgi:hypothetical protein